MAQGPHENPSHLRLVSENATHDPACDNAPGITSKARDVDWAILMAHAQDGDSDAYLRLLQETTPYLRSLARRWYHEPQDIEDAVQDIFLTMHAIRHTYDPARPFGPWLVAIASRRLVDRLRHQGRRKARETPLTTEHETFIGAGTNLEEEPDRKGLVAAISRLPPKQRQAISLLKLKEMSLKEAAKASGMSIVSLKVATHRALKNLRKMLTDGKDT
jgi:RNA polymerase sigma-70 factor (ECF subfamily)